MIPANICLCAAVLLKHIVLWGGVALLLASLCLVTVWARRRRRAIWKRFARRHGLGFSFGDGRPAVTGQLGPRDFELQVSGRSSDTGLAGIQQIVMRLSISCPVSAAFDLTNMGVLETTLHKTLGEEMVTTGDEDFDREAALRTSEPDTVKRYFGNQRRAAILKLFSENSGCEVRVTNSEIRIDDRSTAETVASLDARLQSMLTAAAALEAIG